MIFRIIAKLMGKHLLLHLIIPVLVGFFAENLTDRLLHGTVAEILAKIGPSVGPRWVTSSTAFFFHHAGFFVGVVGTYFVIAFILLYRETNVQIDPADLAELEEVLKTSESYFAVSATGFHDWFDPYCQVYFSQIAGRKISAPNFKPCRVMLFFREAELQDMRSDFLDGLHAKAFRDLHSNYTIPLAFLRPKELREILLQQSPEDLAGLGCIPKLVGRSRLARIAQFIIRHRRRMKSLAFAIVEQSPLPTAPATKPVFLVKFQKHEANVRLQCVSDPAVIRPFLNLANQIKATIMLDVSAGRLHPKNTIQRAIY